MKLSQLKEHLNTLDKNQSLLLQFKLPNGSLVAPHFHITEVGKVSKHFIDCGGTTRTQEVINLQLWQADDYDHRLTPNKLLDILTLAESKLKIGDLEIEVEYQGQTIQKFGLDFEGGTFLLTTKQTDCLAKDSCLPPPPANNSCTPGSGCC